MSSFVACETNGATGAESAAGAAVGRDGLRGSCREGVSEQIL